MLRESTSAGRSVVSARSIADHPLDGLGGDALAGADDRDQLVEQPLGQRDLGGLAVQADPVAAHVHVGAEGALDQAEVLVAGPEHADHVDAVGDDHDVLGRGAVARGVVRVGVSHGCPVRAAFRSVLEALSMLREGTAAPPTAVTAW